MMEALAFIQFSAISAHKVLEAADKALREPQTK
jgi:hypothetical protein